MQDLLKRFIQEEDGDVVQNVIIIAIFAALALMFGNTIKEFVVNLVNKIASIGGNAENTVGGIPEKGNGT